MIQIIIILVVVAGISAVTGLIQRYLPGRMGKRCLGLIFAVYLAGNLYFTLFSRVVGSGAVVDLRPFGSYLRLFEEEIVGYENAVGFAAMFLKNTSPIDGQILNVLLYCPMGYLLPAVFPKLRPRQVVGIGCLAAIATEIMQFLLQMGWCETDDVIHNTLGAAIGVWIWHVQSKRWKNSTEKD